MNFYDFLKNKMKKDFHFGELFLGFSVALVLRVVGLFVSYIFILLVSRLYGAKGVGVFALSYTFLIIFATIGKMGSDTAFLKYCAENRALKKWILLKDIYKKILIIATTMSILVSLFLFFSSNFIADVILKKEYMSLALKIVAFAVFPMVILVVFSEGLRGFKQIKEYMLIRFVGLNITAIFFVAVFYLLKQKLNIFSHAFLKDEYLPVISFAVSVVVIAVVSFLLWKKFYRKFSDGQIGGSETTTYKEIFSLSLPLLLSSSLALIIDWSDTVMLGMFRTAEEVGYYNVAIRVGKLLVIILVAINTIAAPKFAEFWGKKDIDGLVKIARQSTKLIFWITLPIFLFLLIFPGFVLSIFGKEFSVASLSLVILVSGFFFNAICGSVRLILQMTGYQVYHQNIIFLGAVLNVVLNYYLIPLWGINGAAFSSTITMIFWNVVFSIKIKKITGKWIFYPALYKR